ncbi:hypothetical protein T4B_2010 [Trichinella pseudospiralis]|uniref:Uncharacterized protein n=2 Tax=Trichinella pseudospiralis TaxID=6337 RepID=A0A0V1JYY4_TRIPS|nr:hypothetical protein T4D_10639 [Trichinella pseudospiralis]KRZ25181.1 hypothetical protein T4B_2010 [Trichinella pseudospiralis]KRZ40170.1 hypothetical protein T4C_13592 [Trichinella pseudospiralis]
MSKPIIIRGLVGLPLARQPAAETRDAYNRRNGNKLTGYCHRFLGAFQQNLTAYALPAFQRT